MEFWRLRGLAYIVGAYELADNVRLNLLDALHFPQADQIGSSSLRGKVSPSFPIPHRFLPDTYMLACLLDICMLQKE